MISLFIDSSSENLYISLIKDKKLIYEKIIKSKNDHSSYLVSSIREGLEKNSLKIQDIKKVLVSIGPGSFTGTRISVTVAKTLCYSLKINVIPISSLKQCIFEYVGYDYYIPIIEDKKGLYFSVYDKNYNDYMKEKYILKEDLEKYINSLNGKILIISDTYKNNNYEIRKRKINFLNIYNYYEDNIGINPHSLKPNYIKKIEAEIKL